MERGGCRRGRNVHQKLLESFSKYSGSPSPSPEHIKTLAREVCILRISPCKSKVNSLYPCNHCAELKIPDPLVLPKALPSLQQ